MTRPHSVGNREGTDQTSPPHQFFTGTSCFFLQMCGWATTGNNEQLTIKRIRTFDNKRPDQLAIKTTLKQR